MANQYTTYSGGGGGSYTFTPPATSGMIEYHVTVPSQTPEREDEMSDNSFYDAELAVEVNDLAAAEEERLREERARELFEAWDTWLDDFSSTGFWFTKYAELSDGTEKAYMYTVIYGNDGKWYTSGRKHMPHGMTDRELMTAMAGLGIWPDDVKVY